VPTPRLASQIAFLLEADKLRHVNRRTYLADGSRHENSAEHSWHLSLAILTLAEYAPAGVDAGWAVRMAIVHDLVEIDAGDTFVYDATAQSDRAAREQAAADRLFGLLPEDQCHVFRRLWEEFEAGETADARFALALDRFCPMLLNLATEGRAWREHGVNAAQVRAFNRAALEPYPELWGFLNEKLGEAVGMGWLEGE